MFMKLGVTLTQTLEGDKFVEHALDTDEFGNFQAVFRWNTHSICNGPEDVGEAQL